jgi:hypothetical protein
VGLGPTAAALADGALTLRDAEAAGELATGGAAEGAAVSTAGALALAVAVTGSVSLAAGGPGSDSFVRSS